MTTNTDTDWDIEKYRTNFESDEHWELKKNFMEAHKDRIPEERLICLAQVYINIELLRCRYPDKVMEQIAVLSKELGHDYKERQKKRLKRTFVTASDAATARVRGDKKQCLAPGVNYSQNPKIGTSGNTRTKVNFVHSGKLMTNKFIENSGDIVPGFSGNIKRCDTVRPSETNRNFVPGFSGNIRRCDTVTPSETNKNFESFIDYSNPLCEIVILIHSYSNNINLFSLLHNSLGFSKKVMKVEYSNYVNTIVCTLKTEDGLFLGKAKGESNKEARENASIDAMKTLLKFCYVLKVKKLHFGNEISSEEVLGPTGKSSEDSTEETAPNNVQSIDNNIGAKLLKMMGWTGGGLGKDGEGIKEPVKAKSIIGRSGLGLGAQQGVTSIFKERVSAIIQDYLRTEDIKDIVFTSDLSNEQRKFIHQKVCKLGKRFLKTRSYNEGAARYIVLSRKPSSSNTLQMILNQGGETDKYEIIKPSTLTIQDVLDMKVPPE